MIVSAPTSLSIRTEITLPASKSISNRLLIIRHLAGEPAEIANLSEADDTRLLQYLLEIIHRNKGNSSPVTIDCRNAGTVCRFLTALLAVTPGNWLITGSERMQQRPLGALVDALKLCGADISYLKKSEYPPLSVRSKKLQGGITLQVPGNISSQFISALMLIAPALEGGLRIEITSKVVSEPYIQMTAHLMRECGADARYESGVVEIGTLPYSLAGKELSAELDWSSAAFWYEIAALSNDAEIFLPGLKLNGLQGDSIAAALFRNFGISTAENFGGLTIVKEKRDFPGKISMDFTSCPDLAQAVAVTCAGLNIPARLTGLSGLRIKETDRLTALAGELQKAGFKAEANNGSELILSGERISPPAGNLQIETYGDHRMAMAFAPLSLVHGIIRIKEHGVVTKSYPAFWSHMSAAGFVLSDR